MGNREQNWEQCLGDARRLCPRIHAASRPTSQRLPKGHGASAAPAPSTAHGEHFGSSPLRSSNGRASLPCSTAWGGGTRGSQLTIEQHGVGETWFFHQVEKNHQLLPTAALPRCPSTPMPTPYLRGAGSSGVSAAASREGSAHPSPSIPVPHPPGSLPLTAWGEPGGVSPLSPASRNPLCPHLDSFAFTTEPLEWAQGAALAPRSLQDSPSSPSPCPGAAPAQAARNPASVSPLGEGSPLQPVLAVSKQPLMDAARAAHD